MEEIDLKEIFELIKNKYKLIIAIVLGVCILGSLYSLLFQKPMYQSYTTVILGSTEGTTSSQLTTQDINLNKSLVDTYAVIVKSRRVLNQAIERLELDIDYDDLTKLISVSAVNDTQIIKITVSNDDPVMAKNIANVVAEYFSKEVVELYNMNNVDVLDSAIEADKPYNISIIKSEVIYIAVGVVLAAGVIFLIYYFDRTVKTTEQVENKIKLPIIGKVQKYNHDMKKTEIVVESKPKSNLSEDIRTIRTNLQFSSVDKENKTLLVCSSVPGEGKSFISTNLSATFAQTGLKVLLVDCDLRLGRIHEIFGLSNSEGLSNLLTKKEDVNYASFIKKTPIKNLYVMTRGAVPPNPSELLNSSNTKKMMNALKEVFDVVIFDGVPVNGLPDSLIMASMVDRTLVVCSAGYTNMDDLAETKKALANVNANIAGVVVNKTKDAKSGKYYRYYE